MEILNEHVKLAFERQVQKRGVIPGVVAGATMAPALGFGIAGAVKGAKGGLPGMAAGFLKGAVKPFRSVYHGTKAGLALRNIQKSGWRPRDISTLYSAWKSGTVFKGGEAFKNLMSQGAFAPSKWGKLGKNIKSEIAGQALRNVGGGALAIGGGAAYGIANR